MMAVNKFKGLINKSRAGTPDLKSPRTPKTLQIPEGVPETSHETTPTQENPQPETRPRHKSIAEEAKDLVEARTAYLSSAEYPDRNEASSGKGHAQDPTGNGPPLLGIGLGIRDEFAVAETPADILSDSPTGIDFDIYDRAFEAEMERIRSEKHSSRRTTYITRLVNEKEKYFGDDCMIMEAGRSIPAIASSGVNKASSAAVKTLNSLGLTHRRGSTEVENKEGSRRDQLKEAVDAKRTESHDSVQSIKEKGHRFAELVMGTMAGGKINESSEESKDSKESGLPTESQQA